MSRTRPAMTRWAAAAPAAAGGLGAVKRLYLFSGDMGTSVNGNNTGGFKVARLVRGAC